MGLQKIYQFLYKEQFENVFIGISVMMCYIIHRVFSKKHDTINNQHIKSLREKILFQKEKYNSFLTMLDDIELRAMNIKQRLQRN